MYSAKGVLQYSQATYGPKLIVLIDAEIAHFYRALIPRYFDVQSPRYPAHISVVRKAQPANMFAWEKYAGQTVEFNYSPLIQCSQLYYWLDVYSYALEAIREELGLSLFDSFNRLPEGYKHRFHITLANCKHHSF